MRRWGVKLKIIRTITVIALLVALCFVGYRYLVEDVVPQTKPTMLDQSPIVLNSSDYGREDLEYLRTIRGSLLDAQKMMDKLDQDITLAQEDDEQEEAEESMLETKKQALFQWNKLHNGYMPSHPTLKKLKTRYEDILAKYREGLTMELEGMNDGNAEKMKEGYKMIAEAKNGLQQLHKAVGN
jgi:hypothetical protein